MTDLPGAPKLFDHAALRARLLRAERHGAETFLLDAVCNDLVERLGTVLRTFGCAVDVGTPLAGLNNALAGRAAQGRPRELFAPEGGDPRPPAQTHDPPGSHPRRPVRN